MIRASERVIVLADSSKFGTPSLHRICDLRRVNIVVTDTDADPELAKEIEALGVDVHRVDPKSAKRSMGVRRK
jgi:DeoR family transcriptional regulator of aga operon